MIEGLPEGQSEGVDEIAVRAVDISQHRIASDKTGAVPMHSTDELMVNNPKDSLDRLRQKGMILPAGMEIRTERP